MPIASISAGVARRRGAQRGRQRGVDLRRAAGGLEQLGQIQPVVGVPGIAPAARLGERDGRVTGGAPRRQLGAQHVQEAQERGPDAIDAVLGHLDDRPFAVAARLLGVQRVAAAGALGDRPQPDLPARPSRALRARAASPAPRPRRSSAGACPAPGGRRRAPPETSPGPAAAGRPWRPRTGAARPRPGPETAPRPEAPTRCVQALPPVSAPAPACGGFRPEGRDNQARRTSSFEAFGKSA